ncbi:hypothetical protein H2198_000967 [Neophaeococcomyces mojaviensis]|uniref:Uncharacterized protein n=1 Tax=Neophaeococcomyces mojaviensis TaxID=3383035 RepID=A0ACC3AIP5_9EURO|nr:hypothetical protein H2198_000967 [Knufia sp. JES_112]
MTTTNGHTNGDPSATLPQWKVLARKHREHQASLIPAEWRLKSVPSPTDEKSAIPIIEQHLSSTELEITSLSQTLPALQSAVRSRKYTAHQVTSAFCHRAALLQQTTQCLTEILFSSALATAESQDAHLEKTGDFIGPLHGIPVSVKDNQDIKDVDSTLGWVGLINHPAKADTPLVETLRSLGAILYCKTNIPQSMMMSDSYNHTYGQSVNSLNRNLISGGSSGGEAALIGGGGSLIGIGTDIGGSVRIPATLQGLYGLLPSVGRVGNRESIRRDKYVVPGVAGPLSRSLDDLEQFLDIYLNQGRPWELDPAVYPIPWRKEVVAHYATKQRMKVAYITDDGVIRCQPPVERAVRETISTFEQGGHEVVDWNDIAKRLHGCAYDLWLRAVLADGGERMKVFCAQIGEPLIEGMLVGKPENHLDTNGRMALFDEIWEFQREYMKMWRESGVDVLVMPTTQWVGLRPKMWVKADMYVGYTSIWNMMNWTALTVPGVTVSKELDRPSQEWTEYKGRSFSDEFNHDGYDVDFVEGMPVGVQLVTGRMGEEKAVGIAKLLEMLKRQ